MNWATFKATASIACEVGLPVVNYHPARRRHCNGARVDFTKTRESQGRVRESKVGKRRTAHRQTRHSSSWGINKARRNRKPRTGTDDWNPDKFKSRRAVAAVVSAGCRRWEPWLLHASGLIGCCLASPSTAAGGGGNVTLDSVQNHSYQFGSSQGLWVLMLCVVVAASISTEPTTERLPPPTTTAGAPANQLTMRDAYKRTPLKEFTHALLDTHMILISFALPWTLWEDIIAGLSWIYNIPHLLTLPPSWCVNNLSGYQWFFIWKKRQWKEPGKPFGRWSSPG